MWNLARPQLDDMEEQLTTAFSNEAGTGLTADELTLLRVLYKRYEAGFGRPADTLMGTELSDVSRQKIHDAYELVQDKRRLARLRASLKLLAERCPYCGYGHIEELDHFLQKAVFKPFSIFPLNLVPCCGPCNRMKPRLPSNVAAQHQVHVYLEDVSQYDMLRADVNVQPGNGGLRVHYRLERPAHMPEELFQRVDHHMRLFKLQERFIRQVNIFLGGLEYGMDFAYASGSEVLKDFLGKTGDSIAARQGHNDWRVALMKGLAECPAFCAGGYKAAAGIQPVA